METPVVRWEAPPTVSRKGRTPDAKYVQIAEMLMARPNEWALVLEQGHQTTAARIRSGRISAFRPRGKFEATARETDEQGRCKVYARYIG